MGASDGDRLVTLWWSEIERLHRSIEIYLSDATQRTAEIERLRAELDLQQKRINRLRYSLEPFARNIRAKSLMAALDHITREDLIQAAEALYSTGD